MLNNPPPLLHLGPHKIPRLNLHFKHHIDLPNTPPLHLRNPQPRTHRREQTEPRVHKSRFGAEIARVRVVDVRQDQVEDDAGDVVGEDAQALGFGAQAQRRGFAGYGVGGGPGT